MATTEQSAPSVAPADAQGSSSRRRGRRERAEAIGVLLLLIVVFLWKPITSPSSYYAPTDVLQNKAIFQVPPPGYQVQNTNQYDPPTLFYPWLKWNRSSLSQFELPTWNPYNASGVPHLGNFESAVFSPFSVPFYVLPFRIALIGWAFLKLFVAGLFTYLFARRVRLGHLGALTASVIFMFSAYNLLWLNWTAAAAAASLPLGLYCGELVVQARDGRRLRLGLAALSLAIAINLFVGYIETTFFAIAIVILWLAVRLGLQRASWRKVLATIGATATGFLLAAVQILPFVQYLGQSTSYALRGTSPPPTLDSRYLGLLGFPNLLGNPSQPYHDMAAIPQVALRNFNEVGSIYVGLITIFLALVGLTALRGKRPVVVVFFAVAALGWAIYAYNIADIEHLLRGLPGLRQAYPGRSDPVLAFSAACLAAAGVDRAIEWSRGRRAARTRLVPIVGLVVLAGGVLGWAFYAKWRLLAEFANVPGSNLGTTLARTAIDDHVLYMSLTFAAGVVAVVLLALAGRQRAIRVGAGALLLAMLFAQSGYLFRHYNPTVDQRYFYPVTPTLTAFTARTGDAQALRLDQTDVTADANLWYRVSTPVSYDAIGVKHYDDLYQHLLRENEQPTLDLVYLGPQSGPRNLAGLQALGIRFVSTGTDYPFGAEVTTPGLFDASGASPVNLGQPGASVTQGFTAAAGGLNLLLVSTGGGGSASCRLALTVEELPGARQVASAGAPCNSPATTFAFPPLPDSAGKQYRVVITGSGGASVLRSAGPAGHVAMAAYATDVPGLQPVDTVGSLRLFAVPGTPAQFFSPAQARSVSSDSQAFGLLEGGQVDVGQTALLDRTGGPSNGSPGSVRVVSRSATSVRLAVSRSDAGWLVARQTHYPGWTATVNGHGVPITRADVAFSAVPVGAGTSQVVLSYQPTTVTIGLILSAVALVVVLALVASAVPWRRR